MKNVVYALVSSCGEYKAEVVRRSNGALEVIPYKWTRDLIPQYGVDEFWEEVRFASSCTDTLDNAVELACGKIHALGGSVARHAGGFLDLSLRFEYNGTAYGDLVLRFACGLWVCDSYYLALDRELLPDREDWDKVREVLRRLLEQWLSALARLPDGETAYLPYDFSDEYTGWLACHRSEQEIVVSRGLANVEGWSFFPSKAGDLLDRPRGFRVDGPTVRGSMSELVEAVRESFA